MQVDIKDLNIVTTEEKGNSGVFSIEPLPTGFGNTIANSLRRVLLTALKGAALTQMRLSGADHQFTTVPGVKEDVVEISLNLKKVRIRMHSENPIILTIDKKGPGNVTAGDIEGSSEVEVLNKDLHIATLADKNTVFKLELVAEQGIGYSAMEERPSPKIGTIVLDALYSPVIKAAYSIEPTRFGKYINLDKIVLTVETDGSIGPSSALTEASNVLKDYFTQIVEGSKLSIDTTETQISTTEEVKRTKPAENISVDELPLQTRTINALKKQGIDTLDKLAVKSDDELEDIKNLGEKSVQEIKKLLKKEGLR